MVSRINRPTTATPRADKRERFVFIATDYRWIGHGTTAARFVKVGSGRSYRRDV